MDDFYALTNMGIAINDLDDNVLVASGWQDICTKFHQVNKDSLKNCIESDLYLTQNIKPGECSMYKCKNNMWDVATPIIVDEKHMGNLFFGQFFFEDEIVDYEVFAAQAEKFGFNKEEYLAALKLVPRWGSEKIKVGMILVWLMLVLNLLGKINLNSNSILQIFIKSNVLFIRFSKSKACK